MYVVGIDENGFGPILGPMVVTATLFELKELYTPNCLWENLKEVVSKTPRDYPEKLTVYNSKEVFKPKAPKSYETLEATVLSFFNLLFKNFFGGFKDFFSQISLDSQGCPEESVYGEVCHEVNFPLPIWANNWPEANRKRLEEEFTRAGIRILGVKSVLVCPGKFNKYLDQFGSKFYLSWLQFEELFKWFLKTHSSLLTPHSKVTVLCGKIGSQKNYLPYLKRGYLEDFAVVPEAETGEISTYNISSASLNFSLSFIKGGDRSHFPIALSSLFGKYIREVFMHHQNLVFRRWDPSLKPVSGYRDPLTKDFIRNTKDLRREMSLPDRCFLRRK